MRALQSNTAFVASLQRGIAKTRQAMNALATSGWPAILGIATALAGVTMLIGAGVFFLRAHQIQNLNNAPSQRVGDEAPGRQFARASLAQFSVPEESTYINDLSRLFKLAKAKGIVIGSIEYRLESGAALPLLVRTLDIHINEDYPKLKTFVAELLSAMPHVSLQELRVDRRDSATLQGQMLLKLAFVYKKPSPVSLSGSSK